MEKLSRVKKFEDLRNQINNGSDDDLNTADVASFQSRLNNLDSNTFKAPNPTPVRRSETMAQYRKDAFDSFNDVVKTEMPQENSVPTQDSEEVVEEPSNLFFKQTSNDEFLESLDDILNNYINEVNEYNSNKGLVTAESVKDEIIDNARNEVKTVSNESIVETVPSFETVEETEEIVQIIGDIPDLTNQITEEPIETIEEVVEPETFEEVNKIKEEPVQNEIIEDKLIDEILDEVESFNEPKTIEDVLSNEIKEEDIQITEDNSDISNQNIEETNEVVEVIEPEIVEDVVESEIIEDELVDKILDEVESFNEPKIHEEQPIENVEDNLAATDETNDILNVEIIDEVVEEEKPQEELIEEYIVEEIISEVENFNKEEESFDNVEEATIVEQAQDDIVENILNEVENFTKEEKPQTEDTSKTEEVNEEIIEEQPVIEETIEEQSIVENIVEEQQVVAETTDEEIIQDQPEEIVEQVELTVETPILEEVIEEGPVSEITNSNVEEVEELEDDYVVDLSDFADFFNEKSNPFAEILEAAKEEDTEDSKEDLFDTEDVETITSLEDSLDISFEDIEEFSIDDIVSEVKSVQEMGNEIFEIEEQPIDFDQYRQEEPEQQEEIIVSAEEIINSYVEPEKEVQLEEIEMPNIDTIDVLEQLNNIDIQTPTEDTTEGETEIIINDVDDTILNELVKELDEQANQLSTQTPPISSIDESVDEVENILYQLDSFVEPAVELEDNFIEETTKDLIDEVKVEYIDELDEEIQIVDEISADDIELADDISTENVKDATEEVVEDLQDVKVFADDFKDEEVQDLFDEIIDDKVEDVIDEIVDNKVEDVIEEIVDIEDTQALEVDELLDELANSKTLSDAEKTIVLEAKELINSLNEDSNSDSNTSIDDSGVTTDEIEDTQVIPVKEDLSVIDIVSEEIQKTRELQLSGLKDYIEAEELKAKQEEAVAQTMFAVKGELDQALKPYADAELAEDEEELEDGELYYYEEANPNKILNLILIVLIVALVAILGVIAYWILLAKGVI